MDIIIHPSIHSFAIDGDSTQLLHCTCVLVSCIMYLA